MSREPEVVQAETELPHQLWNVCFQGRQQGPGLPSTTRTRFHSVLEQGGALPLVQQAAEQQLSVQGRLQSPPPAVTKSPRKEKFNKDFLY